MKFEDLNIEEVVKRIYHGSKLTVLEHRYFPKGWAKNAIHLALIYYENVHHYYLVMICKNLTLSKVWNVENLDGAKKLLSMPDKADLYWPIYKSDSLSNVHLFDPFEGYRLIEYLLHSQVEFDDRISLFVPQPSETSVLNEIEAERQRQDKKWGQQDHSIIEWMPILMEEVGEASKEAVDFHFQSGLQPKDGSFAGEYITSIQSERLYNIRKELIQVAAVAVAIVESIDRNRK